SLLKISPFLKFLYSNCNLISSITLRFPKFNGDYISLMENFSSQIIVSQQNLKKISFECNFTLYNSLLSLKNSNCPNTLNTIIFCGIDFEDISILQEVFNQSNVLESIHIFG